ncbi:MAG: restriction endonuclease subunit S [Candidatus Omnitrophota bacterium]|nr:restriction endonuclease subunit S [Candidatus Omnitrophota bacterium]
MINYSIIQKSQLEGAYRLDAEYYQPEYLTVDKLLLDRSERLSDIAEIRGGKRLPLGETFSKEGVPYIRVVDMQDFYVDLTNAEKIALDLHERLNRYQIKKEEIAVVIVGNTIGLIGFMLSDVTPCNLTENCAKIITKNVSPYYLAVYLASKYGQDQIRRLTVGTAQPKFGIDKLEQLKIFLPNSKFQDIIGRYNKDAYMFFSNAYDLYSQAEDLLLQELRLKDFKAEEDLSCIVNLSDIKSVHRIDAEYFQPKYERIIEKIKKYDLKSLGELVSMKKGFEPGSDEYQDNGKLFLRVSSISKNGLIDKDQKYISDELYSKLKNNFEPKKGEILLTKDATPGVAYVLKESIEGIIASGIMRLKIKEDIDAEYIALCINSIICQMQIERDAGGSIISHWKPEQIKKLQIPILPKSTQQKIADLVSKSHEARKKAKELLEEAKQKVEKMILGE